MLKRGNKESGRKERMKESSVRQQLAFGNILSILLYLVSKQNQHFDDNHAVTKEPIFDTILTNS
jgi:hypothetical protein